MKKNKFTNINAVSYFRWIFRKNESLNQIVFFFLSQVNATSARFFPLFEASNNIRIVYFNGLNVPKTDYFVSKIANILYSLAKRRFEKYEYIHIVGGSTKLKNRFQILHLDDPNYSQKEINFLLNWEKQIVSQGFNSIVVCTNNLTKRHLETLLTRTLIIKIEQGYDSPSNNHRRINARKTSFLSVLNYSMIV